MNRMKSDIKYSRKVIAEFLELDTEMSVKIGYSVTVSYKLLQK